MSWQPRLRTVLILVSLIILVLPLSGIVVLRLYESALVRQTESELIGQAAFIAASYKAAFKRVLSRSSNKAIKLKHYGRPVAPQWVRKEDSHWRPRPAVLDLAVDSLLPRAPDALSTPEATDQVAATIGRELESIIQDAQIITLASIRVLDYRGIVVATTGEEKGALLINRDEIARALQGEHVSVLRRRISDKPMPPLASISRGTRVHVFVTMPVIMHDRVLGVVLLSRTPANIWQALYHKRRLLLFAALVLLAVVVAVSVLTSFTISRPIGAVIVQAEKAAHGEKGAVVALEQPGTWEIARLSEAVADMARTLEKRADYIRDFASHVSHEFKTPLTAIQGAVELLREHANTMSSAERDRFLSNLAEDADRLDTLVRRLLDLARADVVRVEGETAEAGETIQKVVERYRDKSLAITFTDNTKGKAIVMIGADMLASIATNVLENTRQHAGDKATIDIALTEDKAGQQLIIDIKDNGPGISDANAPRIFEPFFTTARKQGGTGLGLAVIKSLLAAHGGDIRLMPSETGAAFRLELPLQPAP